MKIFLYLVGLLALLGAAGCEEEHEHDHGNRGGAYEGGYYGHGAYQQYPDDSGHDHR